MDQKKVVCYILHMLEKELVLIRGIMSGAHHWWDFVPILKSRFPNIEVHTPEIIGNGKAHHRLTPLTPQENIFALKSQVKVKKSKKLKKKIIFGFSLGGMLAAEWALQHPEEVAAIVLINSSFNDSAIYRRFTPYSFFKILGTGLIRDSHKREQIILNMTIHLKNHKVPEISKVFSSLEEEHPTNPANFFRQLWVAIQISLRHKKPNVPVLVLNSAKDRIVHPDCSHKIAELWDAPIICHPTAGHDLTLDDPDWVIEQTTIWLKSIGIHLPPKPRPSPERPKELSLHP